jgi:hypothetical protein
VVADRPAGEHDDDRDERPEEAARAEGLHGSSIVPAWRKRVTSAT